MKPLRQPGDAAKRAKAGLAAIVPGLVGAPSPTVSLGLPGEWTAESPAHIGVFDDAGPVVWPVYTKPRVRVTVWAPGRTEARRIAGICLGVLLAYRIDGLANVTDPTSLIESRDGQHPDAVVVSFTVAAIVRTVAVQ